MITFKHKETGRLYTMVGSCACSEGSYYSLATSPEEGEKFEVKQVLVKDLLDQYEDVSSEIQYESVWPLIANYVHLNPELNNLLNAFLRRNTKDYFEPGKYVMVHAPHLTDLRTYRGPEDFIYVIKTIAHCDYGAEVVVTKDIGSPIELRFRMCLDKIIRDDAYSCLKRLDMPY